MIKASWMVLLTIGLLWSAAGFADDVQSSKTEGKLLPVATLSFQTVHASSAPVPSPFPHPLSRFLPRNSIQQFSLSHFPLYKPLSYTPLTLPPL